MPAPKGNKNRYGKYLKVLIGSAEKLTPELAYILGALKGDAYFCGNKRAVALKATDASFVFEFSRCLKKQFSYRVSFNYRNESHAFIATLCSVPIYIFLKNFDINRITYGGGEIQSSFVRAFADSEGTVGYDIVELSNCNKETLLFTQKILTSLGIQSHLYLVYNGKKIKENWSDCYRLTVMGYGNLLLFYKKIGFSIPRKMNKLKSKIVRSSHLILKERKTT